MIVTRNQGFPAYSAHFVAGTVLGWVLVWLAINLPSFAMLGELSLRGTWGWWTLVAGSFMALFMSAVIAWLQRRRAGYKERRGLVRVDPSERVLHEGAASLIRGGGLLGWRSAGWLWVTTHRLVFRKPLRLLSPSSLDVFPNAQIEEVAEFHSRFLLLWGIDVRGERWWRIRLQLNPYDREHWLSALEQAADMGSANCDGSVIRS